MRPVTLPMLHSPLRRLGAIDTTFWPRARAQRAFCEAEIFLRAAALILRGPGDAHVLFSPLSALIPVSRAFTCCAALCASMSMCSSPGEGCSRYSSSYANLCIDVSCLWPGGRAAYSRNQVLSATALRNSAEDRLRPQQYEAESQRNGLSNNSCRMRVPANRHNFRCHLRCPRFPQG